MLLIVDNIHLFKDLDGNYYTSSIYNDSFFDKYRRIFRKLRIIGKTRLIDGSVDNYIKIAPDIEVIELPWYRGIGGLLKKFFVVIKAIKKVRQGCDCCILRMAQIESILAYVFGGIKKIPFCVETVNDPSSFINVNWAYKKVAIYFLKKINKKALGVSYVTSHILQEKYPCKAILNKDDSSHWTSYYSSIVLKQDEIMPQKDTFSSGVFKLVHVANVISDDNKGHKTVIECVSELIKSHINCEVTFIGEGQYVEDLRKYAESLNVLDYTHFIGRISSKTELLRELRKHDLFIFPSYFEGLPRVVIEAMSVGLPCLASPVGGTPELLDSKYLIDYWDAVSYATTIKRLIYNRDELTNMSINNINTAKEYSEEVISVRRNEFYSRLNNYKES